MKAVFSFIFSILLISPTTSQRQNSYSYSDDRSSTGYWVPPQQPMRYPIPAPAPTITRFPTYPTYRSKSNGNSYSWGRRLASVPANGGLNYAACYGGRC